MCLILNLYKHSSRFGDQARFSVFTMQAVLMQLYCRIKSRPAAGPLTPEQESAITAQKQENEAAVSQAFLKYMSSTDVFADFEENHKDFQKLHGNDPIIVWEQFQNVPDVSELADFAMLILRILVNQGGNERDFSDFKIKQTRLRNRLSFKKTGKMSKFCKVGTSIRTEHIAAGFVDQQQNGRSQEVGFSRKHHSSEGCATVWGGAEMREGPEWRRRATGGRPEVWGSTRGRPEMNRKTGNGLEVRGTTGGGPEVDQKED
ncbi:hypothetical protein B0H10DRAFT_2198284 [Mycena sp. CBHHK59/15]|nr:hypothetical protein B0H10DRAFT_2198284 [Mycena sp. CBHHK59/15]